MQVIGDGVTFDTAALSVGTRFDTDYETGCVVTEAPSAAHVYSNRRTNGPAVNFAALDSEGVECEFSTAMVAWIHR